MENKDSSDGTDEDDDLCPRSLEQKRVVVKSQNMKMKQIKTEQVRKQKSKEQTQDETQWEWTEVCGKIVDLQDGNKALMYISVKRNGCKVVIEQEVANNDDKYKGDYCRSHNIKIVQRKHYSNEILAKHFALMVFQRFINHECFPLTDASHES